MNKRVLNCIQDAASFLYFAAKDLEDETEGNEALINELKMISEALLNRVKAIKLLEKKANL